MSRISLISRIAQPLGLLLVIAATPAHPQTRDYPDPIERDFLAAHNLARVDAGAEPLVWNDSLVRDAQGWADHLAARGLYKHASPHRRKGQGENLWRGPRDRWSAWEMVGFFVDEKRHFRAGQFPDVSRTGQWADVGHYTQVIWPQTREVGCAIAVTSTDEVLVCRYWPAGNIWGQRIETSQQRSRR
ncbi:CAP domain-containing protein [Erythrobacter sp. R86502]|uniref:CAP domain-containing protein n=1 Tax=Erythrobacter sp. R86502 TaxID=3093846 RepID=UPI0036D41348